MGKSEFDRAHLTILGPEDVDNVQGTDGAEPLAGGRIVLDWGGGWVPVFLYAEEDVDIHLDWAGHRGL